MSARAPGCAAARRIAIAGTIGLTPRDLSIAGLAVLFLASLASLFYRLAASAGAGGFPLDLAAWLSVVVLCGAGLGFLVARRAGGGAAAGGWQPSGATGRDRMDALPLGLAIFDAEGRLVFCNRHWRAVFADLESFSAIGGLYEETIGSIAGKPAPDDDGSGPVGERPLDGGTWVRLEQAKLADGGIMVSVTDVTAARARASAASSEQERSRLIISAAGAWIWETDVLHRFSLAVPVRSEVSRDELHWMVGRSLTELASPAGAGGDAGLSKCLEDMDAHRRLTDVALILQDHDRTRTLRLSGVPRINNDGAFLGYCGVGVFDAAPAEPPAPAARAAAPARTVEPAGAHGQRVLLVDDSQTNRLLGVSILKKMGYECDAVENGQRAVDAVREGIYGLVLMDIRMPGMDGFEATSQIRGLPGPEHAIPVVAMTAHVNAEDRQLCLESGMDDHVSKPVDRRILSSVLRRLVGPPGSERPDDGDAATDGPRPGAGDATLADTQILDQLRNDAGPELVSELIASFMTETDERLLRMQTAMKSGDLDSLAAEAHAMKSSSGTFGALRLQVLVQRLEAAANVNDAGLTAELLGRLPELVAESWAEFARAGYPPPE